MSKYSKFFIVLLGVAISVASQYYGTQPWFNAVVGLLTVYGVYRVPNTITDTTNTIL